jgi:hypothetical protein
MTFTRVTRHPGGDDLRLSVAWFVVRPAPATSVESRRLSVVAALRAVRDEEPSIRLDAQPQWVEHRATLAALQAEVRRLADRLERVEDTVELIQTEAEPPLNWPTPVATDSPLEVPPLEVSRRPSPAFDILLGPSSADEARDTA